MFDLALVGFEVFAGEFVGEAEEGLILCSGERGLWDGEVEGGLRGGGGFPH